MFECLVDDVLGALDRLTVFICENMVQVSEDRDRGQNHFTPKAALFKTSTFV